MKGKVCLITGANAGIGLETARGLAVEGATVVLVCRNEERGQAALTDLKKSSDNSDIHLLLADLASQKQIRHLAHTFTSQFSKLDILVNNAGVFLPNYQTTEDGYEATFAINHLAYFLLTHLLLDHLRSAPAPRIVNVSSNAHRSGRINFDALESVESYNGYIAYAQSKLANVLFTHELARRLKDEDITCNALHPGVVSTNIANHGRSLFSFFFNLFRPFLLSAEAGASTSIYLATSSEVDGISGGYFEKCASVKPSKLSMDSELASKLWAVSETLTGVVNTTV